MSRPLAASRLARLSDALARAAARIVVLRQDPHTAVHGVARRILRLMDVSVKMTGKVPPSGLIVCNHLSYLDVVVLSAMAPCVFVAKSDVRRWPAFGWFAKRIGCIFAERDHPASAGRSVGAIQRALDAGHRVVLFPEGTSSDGSAVLPFRSSLLEPAVGRPISVAALSYQLDPGDGDPAVDVCYWRDMTFLPHLVRLLGKGRIHARLAMEPFEETGLDRKALARELHSRVELLRAPNPARPARPPFLRVSRSHSHFSRHRRRA